MKKMTTAHFLLFKQQKEEKKLIKIRIYKMMMKEE